MVGANPWYIVGEDHWYMVGANPWYIIAEDYWYIVARGVTILIRGICIVHNLYIGTAQLSLITTKDFVIPNTFSGCIFVFGKSFSKSR